MKPKDIRKTYRRETAASQDEANRTAQEVETDPEAARKLWQVILAMAPTDGQFQAVLQAILQSVLIDIVSNNMQGSDEFALVIGRRMVTMMDAAKPGWRGARSRTNKTA